MNKRASIIIMAVILGALLGIIYLGSIQFTQRQTAIETEKVEQGYRGTLGSHGELFKKYSYHAFRHATTKGSFETALSGGGRAFWVSYSCATPPDVSAGNQKIGAESEESFNKYMETIDKYDLDLSFVNESAIIDDTFVYVTNDDVLEPPLGRISDGPVDESFIVSGRSKNETVEIISYNGDEKRSFNHAYTIEIWPLRYWYMYRRIKTWIGDAFVRDRICDAMDIVQLKTTEDCNRCDLPGKLTESQTRRILDAAVLDLESYFDGLVDCEYELGCFYSRVEYPHTARYCENGCDTTGCTYIRTTKECFSWFPPSNDQYNCLSWNVGAGCYGPYSGWDGGSGCNDPNYDLPQTCHGYGVNQYANFHYTMSCTDNKYQSPIKTDDFKNLVFRIAEHIAWEHLIGPPDPCR